MMQPVELKPPHRQAAPDDSVALAELVNIAGEGMPLYLWGKMAAASGEDPWAIGRQRAQRETGGFSYRNTIVRVEDNAVIGTAFNAQSCPEQLLTIAVVST